MKEKPNNIVFGNVQLAEDRIPSCLLVFRKDDEKEVGNEAIERPRTGFVHDALFYFEAEKPLRMLALQRRRWLNGTYAAYLWVHRERWIWQRKHHWLRKLFAATFIMINLLQGAFIRLCAPAVMAVGLYASVMILPDLTKDPSHILSIMYDDASANDIDPMRIAAAALSASAYMIFYAIFMYGHTPRAVPVKANDPTGKWRSDRRSAFRPLLFGLAFVINMVLVLIFLGVSGQVLFKIGWNQTPIVARLMVLLFTFPYGLAILDGCINSQYPNLKSFFNLVRVTPYFMLSSIWFGIWFPAYASARVSDLTWGNRDAGSEDEGESAVAKRRAKIGKMVSTSLVLSNFSCAALVIGSSQYVPGFLKYAILLSAFFMGFFFVMSLCDMILRFWRRIIKSLCCFLIIHKSEHERDCDSRESLNSSNTSPARTSSTNVSMNDSDWSHDSESHSNSFHTAFQEPCMQVDAA